MLQQTFSTSLVAEKMEGGQGILADAIKTLIFQRNPDFFERLDFNNDFIFLEPLLFAWFNDPAPVHVSLEQLLIGYIADEKKPNELQVHSDENGIIYLPNMGYLKTRIPLELFRLNWTLIPQSGGLTCKNELVEYTFENLYFIPDTSIEVLLHNHPLLKPIFSGSVESIRDMEDNGSKSGDLEIEHITRIQRPKLEAALKAIRICNPQMYEQITSIARRVVIFDCAGLWSFATIAGHGTAFLSCTELDGELFFVAELAHQFGHNVLNAACADRDELFVIDPISTRMSQLSGNEKDERSLFGAFHGAYTTAKVAEVLDSCYQKEIYTGTNLYELKGRLVDNRRRFRSGIQELKHKEIYTEEGLRMYTEMDELCEDIYHRHAKGLAAFQVSNQPFVFDFSRFKQENP
jgi:hypothetical protein